MGTASPLFGRASELLELKSHLTRALEGEGSTLLFAGEPGIGKSRLADELAAQAEAAGASVHWGRGWEGGGAPAYWPWTEALTSLAAGLDAPHLAALVGEDAPEMVRLVPQLRSRLPNLEAASLPDADEARFRLASAVVSTLRRAAAVRPRVVILDDLHMADGPTLSCLQVVARSLRGLRVLLVGTYRDAEVRISPALAEKIGVLSREATTLQLSALDRTASLAMIQERSSLVGDVATAIAEATGGNPLFLNEMSRLVAARGGVQTAGQQLPVGIQENIRQRLALLPAEAVRVLETAACMGREFDPAVIAPALGLGLGVVLTPLESAAAAGMVIAREHGQRAFSHDLVREVLYRGLPRERRVEIHQKLAAAMAALGTPTVEAASAVANHLLESSEVNPPAAIRAAIDAARGALDVVAFEHALSLLERAQAVANRTRIEPRRVAELWIGVGEAKVRAGQVAAGKEACREALSIARGLRDAELISTAALTWGSEIQPGMIDADLVAWLEEARAALGDAHPRIRARILARLAAALQPALNPQGPVAMAREAISLARETADDRTLLEVLHAGMAAMMEYVDPHERLPLNLEQESLAQRFHDRPRELRARLRLVFDYFVIGDLGMAETRARSFAALAQQLRQARFAWFLPSWNAARATFEGRFGEVDAMLNDAAEKSSPGPLGEVRNFVQRLELASVSEDRTAVRAIAANLPTFTGMALGQFMVQTLVGSALARLGDSAAAEELFAAATRSWAIDAAIKGDARAQMAESDPGMLASSGEIFQPGDPLLSFAYQKLLPMAGLQAGLGMIGVSWVGPIDRILGRMAFRAGRLDAAVSHYEAAVASLLRLNGRGQLARAWLESAEVRLARNAAGDLEVARTHAAAGRTLAGELGQTGLIAQFEKRVVVDTAPITAPVAAPSRGPAVSLRREGEYWELQGSGRSFRLKDSRGLQMLSRLLERPDQEVHCLELASDGPQQEVDGGDSGELLDADAKRQYRARMEDLQEELREADQFSDVHRARRAREELEFLAGELSRAVGLGGRARKGSSATERARVAVQRRIKDAIGRIVEHEPELGRHLEWAVKTGTYCCYRPSR